MLVCMWEPYPDIKGTCAGQCVTQHPGMLPLSCSVVCFFACPVQASFVVLNMLNIHSPLKHYCDTTEITI
jgi:hypothetical protein